MKTHILVTVGLFLFIFNDLSAQKGRLTKTINTELPVSCIQISPDKDLIAIADDTEDPFGFQELDEEFKITILNSADYTVKFELLGHQESIEACNFSLDSKQLISCDITGEITVWDLTSGTEVISIKTGEWVHNVKFTSSGNEFIAIQGFEKVALIYDLNGNLIEKLQVNEQINDFDYNPKTNQIYFGCHDEFQVWSLVTRKMTSKISHEGLMCMSFNHDYSKLGIGTLDGEIILLTLELEEIKKLKGHFKPVLSISFSFDNKKIASSSSDQTARVWDLKKASEILQLTNEHKGRVSSVEFISDKYEFMTGGENRELKVWK